MEVVYRKGGGWGREREEKRRRINHGGHGVSRSFDTKIIFPSV